MSCYHPNVMRTRVDSSTGQLVYTFLGPAERVGVDALNTVDDFVATGEHVFLIPCGTCIGCRIDHSRNWANRMILELQDCEKAIFVTLTYDNNHLPRALNNTPTLDVRDCQLFFKRLRKRFTGTRIRYYLAGEYGPKTLRPHYHAIIYGLSLSDFPDLRVIGHNELKQVYYTSPLFEQVWSNGFVQMSEVSHKTCAYVARYTLKKQYGNSKYYKGKGISPEFSLSSRKPGIGLLHAKELVLSGNSQFTVDGLDGVYSMGLSKAFLRAVKSMALSAEEQVIFNDLIVNRRRVSEARLQSDLMYTEVDYIQYLKSKEALFARKIAILPDRKECDL